MSDAATHYLEEARRQLRGHKRMGEGAMSQLRDEEFFVTIDPEANSVAILVKHLAGNMRSRFSDFLTSDGEKPDRDRDQEFIDSHESVEQLVSIWQKGWHALFHTLDHLSVDNLMKTIYIRREPHTVIQAINRQLAHYVYHCGQIVLLAKHYQSEKWRSLSVPRGKSGSFNRQVAAGEASQR